MQFSLEEQETEEKASLWLALATPAGNFAGLIAPKTPLVEVAIIASWNPAASMNQPTATQLFVPAQETAA
jgi:hypothetical protein